MGTSLKIKPRLYTRDAARVVLGGYSYSTIVRLEKSGKLTPIKLGGPKSRTHYAVAEVHALAGQPDA